MAGAAGGVCVDEIRALLPRVQCKQPEMQRGEEARCTQRRFRRSGVAKRIANWEEGAPSEEGSAIEREGQRREEGACRREERPRREWEEGAPSGSARDLRCNVPPPRGRARLHLAAF